MEYISINKLKLLKTNPRKISPEQLNKLQLSLREDPLFLEKRPILVNKKENEYYVYAGNQRVKAAKKLGWEKIPCIIDIDLDEDIIKARTIKDNKNSGEWDFDILKKEYELDNLLQWGFNSEELNFDIKDIVSSEDKENNNFVPTENPKTEPNDLYILGNHRLLCGDCTLPENVNKLLENQKPILMVTDPPYGVNYEPSWRDAAGKACRSTGKVENDDQHDWSIAWSLFPGDIAYVWHSAIYTSQVKDSLIKNDFQVISQIIWAKNHFCISRGDYHWQHEPCWYVHRKGCKHNWQGSRKETTLWQIQNHNCFAKKNIEEEKNIHSTQKPIECMARPIRNNSSVGEGIYDPFVGSGTTLIAAEILNRKCFAIEINPSYCDIVIERWIKNRMKNNKEAKIIKNGEEIDWLDVRKK